MISIQEETNVKNRMLAVLLALLLLCAGACAEDATLAAMSERMTQPIEWATLYEPLPIEETKGPLPQQSNYLPENTGYVDESISVKIETIREYDTTIMVAYVQIQHPSQIRTTMAGRYGTTKVTFPKFMAERMNAVFAVNGDYFNYRKSGYLVRQGKLYRDRPDPEFDLLMIDDQGDFHIIRDPSEESVHAYVEQMAHPVINSFNFGPALIMNGEKVLPVKGFDGGTTKKTQRLAIAQMGPLSYMMVATEGPENAGSVGLTVEELIDLMADLGAPNAYNLDGGSSSTFVLDNEKINALSSKKNRTICDIVYFATLVPEAK